MLAQLFLQSIWHCNPTRIILQGCTACFCISAQSTFAPIHETNVLQSPLYIAMLHSPSCISILHGPPYLHNFWRSPFWVAILHKPFCTNIMIFCIAKLVLQFCKTHPTFQSGTARLCLIIFHIYSCFCTDSQHSSSYFAQANLHNSAIAILSGSYCTLYSTPILCSSHLNKYLAEIFSYFAQPIAQRYVAQPISGARGVRGVERESKTRHVKNCTPSRRKVLLFFCTIK